MVMIKFVTDRSLCLDVSHIRAKCARVNFKNVATVSMDDK